MKDRPHLLYSLVKQQLLSGKRSQTSCSWLLKRTGQAVTHAMFENSKKITEIRKKQDTIAINSYLEYCM